MQKTIHHLMNTSKYFRDQKYDNLIIQSQNTMGILQSLWNIFANNQINLTFIKSRIKNQNKRTCLDISIKKQPLQKITKLQHEISELGATLCLEKPIQLPWFPRVVADLDLIGKYLLRPKDGESNQDHPQFTDMEYRKRRDFIASVAHQFKMGQTIPDVPYTKQENDLWVDINQKLEALHPKAMSQRYLRQKENIQKRFRMSKRIPQLNQLSEFLKSQTGFSIKPTHGILSQREFLNCLAFRVFCCTQYIRHYSDPEYTPEPDVVHEIIGHVPTFADPYVAQISQKIGILSLGATDEQIVHLGALYLFTLQFGACIDDGKKVGYGAGIASCVAQIKNFMSGKATFRKLDPIYDCKDTYPIQSVQPCYRFTETFEEALESLEAYGSKNITKPITIIYNDQTKTIQYDRNIEGIDTGDKPIQFV